MESQLSLLPQALPQTAPVWLRLDEAHRAEAVRVLARLMAQAVAPAAALPPPPSPESGHE